MKTPKELVSQPPHQDTCLWLKEMGWVSVD